MGESVNNNNNRKSAKLNNKNKRKAALWCLLHTDSFQSCLLEAVNLGEDTDTVGAVAGGLAGIRYGLAAIPEEWLSVLARREEIEALCEKFAESLF